MTCIEYLKSITSDGSRVILPKGMTEQHTITTGNEKGTSNGLTVVCYKSESLSNAKQEEKMVEKITLLALNTPSDKASIKRFYNHCLHIVPNDFKDGEYVYKEWLELVLSLALSISAELTKLVIKERHFKGADTLLRVLQTRIDSWNSKILLSDNGGDKATTVIFERF